MIFFFTKAEVEDLTLDELSYILTENLPNVSFSQNLNSHKLAKDWIKFFIDGIHDFGLDYIFL